MSNYQAQILDLIHQNPDIRTIQIVDEVDLDIDIVENHLTAAIRDKMITMTPVIGPNMLKANSYKINPIHAYWKDRKQVVTAIATKSNDKVIRAAEMGDQRRKPASKIQKALDFLAGRPSATRLELSDAMGIDPVKYHPTQYLLSLLKSGQILRDGDIYKLGSALESAEHITKWVDQQKPDLVKVFKVSNVVSAPVTITAETTPVPAVTMHQPHISFTLEKFKAVKNCLPPDEYKAFIKASVILCMMAGPEGFQVGAALAQQLAEIDQGATA